MRTLEVSPLVLKIGDQAIDAAQFKVALENEPDGVCFVLVDGELAIVERVAERNHAADPQALALGGGDLVADALGGDLAFELSEGQQNIKVKRPIDVVVLNCWVTETNDTP